MALVFSHLRFNCRTVDRIVLPPFSGSTLRGCFGHALKANSCQSAVSDCENCRIGNCAYQDIFETPVPKGAGVKGVQKFAPHPFIITGASPGRKYFKPMVRFSFDLYLIGRSIELLPVVTDALLSAGMKGIGPVSGRFVVDTVTDIASAVDIWKSGKFISSSETILFEQTELPPQEYLMLEVISPLRIIEKSILMKKFDVRLILNSIQRRVELLNHYHGNGAELVDEKRLGGELQSVEAFGGEEYVGLSRRSNRQGHKVPIDGIKGMLFLRNAGPVIHLLLRAATVFGIGKGAAYGLGRVTVTSSNSLSEVNIEDFGPIKK